MYQSTGEEEFNDSGNNGSSCGIAETSSFAMRGGNQISHHHKLDGGSG